MLITTVIGLRYDTTPEQLRRVLARMRQVCFAHPKIETKTLRVRFTDFGTSSLDVTVRVYALANGWTEWYAIREDLYLRFMEVIGESGTSVAIPSRTLYLGRDSGLDPERTEAAERDVAAWREADELPFPYTPEPLAARITDTLDYPPRGSPEAIGEDVAHIKAEPLGGEDTPDGEAPDAPHRLR
jgi:MscS family membrane protein